MTVVFPFHNGDAGQLKQLLEWINLLGRCNTHTAILCADCGVPYATVMDLMKLAQAGFRTVGVIASERVAKGWPQGANELFRTTVKHMGQVKTGPWLWCEPDCIPLKPEWLNTLEAAYKAGPASILGAVIACDTPGLPPQHVSGCAIYPDDLASRVQGKIDRDFAAAFDIEFAQEFVGMASNSHLFQCFWGQRDLPPTFVPASQVKGKPHEFTLNVLQPQSVLFHRSKDGTLIRQLRAKMFPQFGRPSDFIVVLPFSNKDAPLQIECCKWMAEMGQTPRYDCLLSYDQVTINPFTSEMMGVAKKVFRNVYSLSYAPPPAPSWPQAPNWVFQQTARYIEKNIHRPWLWKEPDMIPLKQDWIEQLQDEYQRGGKPFMGSVVPGLGHANGTSVFPADMPARCPRAMNCVGEAFDTAMKGEMMPSCHNSIHLMQHIWGLHGGRPHPIVGEPIVFSSEQQVREWVDPHAVTIHRVKNVSLIEQMRKMK